MSECQSLSFLYTCGIVIILWWWYKTSNSTSIINSANSTNSDNNSSTSPPVPIIKIVNDIHRERLIIESTIPHPATSLPATPLETTTTAVENTPTISYFSGSAIKSN
jgi:hypothetical protein